VKSFAMNRLGPFHFAVRERVEDQATCHPYGYAGGHYFSQRMAILSLQTASGELFGAFEVPLLQFLDQLLRVLLESTFRASPAAGAMVILDHAESLHFRVEKGRLLMNVDHVVELAPADFVDMAGAIAKALGAEVKMSAQAGWLGPAQLYAHNFVLPISFSEDLGEPLG
jgi:hypothetical protein